MNQSTKPNLRFRIALGYLCTYKKANQANITGLLVSRNMNPTPVAGFDVYREVKDGSRLMLTHLRNGKWTI